MITIGYEQAFYSLKDSGHHSVVKFPKKESWSAPYTIVYHISNLVVGRYTFLLVCSNYWSIFSFLS